MADAPVTRQARMHRYVEDAHGSTPVDHFPNHYPVRDNSIGITARFLYFADTVSVIDYGGGTVDQKDTPSASPISPRDHGMQELIVRNHDSAGVGANIFVRVHKAPPKVVAGATTIVWGTDYVPASSTPGVAPPNATGTSTSPGAPATTDRMVKPGQEVRIVTPFHIVTYVSDKASGDVEFEARW